MSTECEKGTCPCGITCQNRRFQQHQDACVYPKQMGAKGFGLIAGEKIKKGQFVIQYIGEVLSLSSEEGIRRLNENSKSTCTYMMKLGGNEVIDPTYKGNMARFINHSCDPNCETQKWNVLGEICVGIFAIKDIEPGEELTFNYQFDVYQTPFTRCLCGAPNCKKYLGLVPPEYTPEEWFEKVENMPCEICGSNDAVYDDEFLLCDNCNRGFHTFCLDPPLEKIPEGAWFCPKCLKLEEEKKKAEASKMKTNPVSKEVMQEISLTKILRRDKEAKQLLKQQGRVKKVGRPRKKVPTVKETLIDPYSDYNEFYNLQKSLQRELIKQIDKDALIDLEEEVEVEEVIQKKPEKLTRMQEIRGQIMKNLTPMLTNTGLVANLSKKKYIEKLNADQKIKRRSMSISTLELSIFKEYFFRKTNKMRIRLSYDVNPYKRDIFAKKNEFRIQCNDQQFDWFQDLFRLMDRATGMYKQINGFTTAFIHVPAIFLKRVVGEYQKNVHYVQSEFQVLLEYDKSYITDECYPMSEETKISLKGNKENIIKAVEYLQGILDVLEVRRILMGSSDIKIIIANLMPIKQQIHPSEIRCCRDNALRDINHPFYTIYYKDKEVAFVGTKEELDKSIFLVESEIAREKQIKKNIFSLNFLIPVCDKYHLIKIKERIERTYPHTKMIIYDPLLPRKNVSLTLISNYIHFDNAYEDMRDAIDSKKLFSEKFEDYQRQTIYQMTKYFFKYLQNYFQTESTIFMKAWDTMTLGFLGNCNQYNSIFKGIKSLYIRDHELKFYILSVTKMSLHEGQRSIGLLKQDIITICKTILNRSILYDNSLYSKNYQSIFSFDSDLPNFLQYYNPKTYFDDYSNEKMSTFERSLRNRLMDEDELKKDKFVNFPRRERRYSPRKEYRRENYHGKQRRSSHHYYKGRRPYHVESRHTGAGGFSRGEYANVRRRKDSRSRDKRRNSSEEHRRIKKQKKRKPFNNRSSSSESGTSSEKSEKKVSRFVHIKDYQKRKPYHRGGGGFGPRPHQNPHRSRSRGRWSNTVKNHVAMAVAAAPPPIVTIEPTPPPPKVLVKKPPSRPRNSSSSKSSSCNLFYSHFFEIFSKFLCF